MHTFIMSPTKTQSPDLCGFDILYYGLMNSATLINHCFEFYSEYAPCSNVTRELRELPKE